MPEASKTMAATGVVAPSSAEVSVSAPASLRTRSTVVSRRCSGGAADERGAVEQRLARRVAAQRR